MIQFPDKDSYYESFNSVSGFKTCFDSEAVSSEAKQCKKKALITFFINESECKEKCNEREQCNFITIWGKQRLKENPAGDLPGCTLFEECDKLRINNTWKDMPVDASVVLAKNGATCPKEWWNGKGVPEGMPRLEHLI